MKRALQIIIGLAFLVVVALIIVKPLLGSDEKPKDTTAAVIGIGGNGHEAFFRDRRVVKAMRQQGIKVKYEPIGDRQIGHALRFGEYSFVWADTPKQTEAARMERRDANAVDVAGQMVYLATPAATQQLRASGAVDGVVLDPAKLAASGVRASDAVTTSDPLRLMVAGGQGAPIMARTTRSRAEAIIGQLPPGSLLLTPQLGSGQPLLALDDEGDKIAELLTTNQQLIELLIEYESTATG